MLNLWNDDSTVAESTNLFQTMGTTELTSIQITSIEVRGGNNGDMMIDEIEADPAMLQ